MISNQQQRLSSQTDDIELCSSVQANEIWICGETNEYYGEQTVSIAIALIGATLGTAGALAMKNTAHNVNKTVKNVGYVFKMQLLVLTKM